MLFKYLNLYLKLVSAILVYAYLLSCYVVLCHWLLLAILFLPSCVPAILCSCHPVSFIANCFIAWSRDCRPRPYEIYKKDKYLNFIFKEKFKNLKGGKKYINKCYFN